MIKDANSKVKCTLYNRWYWSIEKAGIMIDSPSGGSIWIPKGRFAQMKDKTEEERELVVSIGESVETEFVSLSRTQMQTLLNIAKRCSGAFYRIGTKKVEFSNPQTAPQKVVTSKAKTQTAPSFAKRQFDRAARMRSNFQSIIGGCCPSCNQYKLNVKNHGSWVGYCCKSCGAGGSVTRRDNNKRRR